MGPKTVNHLVAALLAIAFATALPAWAQSQAVPPLVEQQLGAKARAENPPPAGLHLSGDGESYSYASSSSDETKNTSRDGGYQATLGRRLSGGIEISADQSNLSLKLWPVSDALFASPAIEKNGRLIYSGRGARHEYAFKKNGVKEDIVLSAAPSEDLNLMFALRQDGNLDFRLDAKGNVLVYGPGALLSGFVQAGDDKSAELLMKARQSAKKDRLLYAIPAPVILDANGREYRGLAHYTLKGNALTLHTSDLSRLKSPVTIDPSIVVTTTADFGMGNDEGMISFDTDAISRAVPSGGAIGAWGATTVLPGLVSGHVAVVYNGFLYVIGGLRGASLNEVLFAPIEADGALGAWSATSSFSTGRRAHTAAAYNGYLYLAGGNSDTGLLSDVQFAAIHTDGTLGAWAPTTGLTAARAAHSSVAYNGYLYVMGGADDTGYRADVQFAPFNGDGSIGAWAQTSSFSTARAGHTSVACNEYLYVIGGRSEATNLNDVQFAPILADGTVGPWAATASFTKERLNHTSIVCNGYLYVIGGGYYFGTGYTCLGDVQSAALRPNGTLGAWTTTTSLDTVRSSHATAAYKGYVYVIAGWDGSAVLGDVQVARITTDTGGTVGPWSATTSFAIGRDRFASTVYNGYLYVMGGSGTLNDVQYAPVNADGTVGVWSTTTSFPTARLGLTGVAYNGFLYVLGGESGSVFLNDVQFAPIHSDGTVGPWSATTSFGTPRSRHTSVAYGGYLYVIGGHYIASLSEYILGDVQYAAINSDGTLGTWSTTVSLVTSRMDHSSVVHRGFLYVIGGSSNPIHYLDDVQYALINANGTINSWGATTSFQKARCGHTSVAYAGRLYLTGGDIYGYPALTDLQYAPINSDGTLGAWNVTTPPDSNRWYHASVVWDGFVYIIGGNSLSGTMNDVHFAPINADGAADGWNATTAFPYPRWGLASVAYNGYLYVLGGSAGPGGGISDVRYAPFNPDGTVGAWSDTTALNSGKTNHAALAYNGYMYVIGGGFGGDVTSEVLYAPIIPDGRLGGPLWNVSTGFPTPREGHSSVVHNGYLFVVGGRDSGGNYLGDVQFAPLNADGSLGAWTAATSLPSARADHTSVAYGGYLYVIGGQSSGGYLDDVQFAPINPDGTVGAWTATRGFPTPRIGHTSVAYNGFLCVAGGWDGSWFLDDVQFSPFNADGTVGDWSATARIPSARKEHASAAYNGHLYVIGGFDGDPSHFDDVQFAALRGPAARGAYSKLIDTGPGNRIMESLIFNSSAGGSSGYTLTYAVAPDETGVFGPRTTIPDAAPGNVYAPLQCGRYVWVRLGLDDTTCATAGSGGAIGRKDVLDISLAFGAGVPPSITSITDNDSCALTGIKINYSAGSGATNHDLYKDGALVVTGYGSGTTYNPGDTSSHGYTVKAINGACASESGSQSGTDANNPLVVTITGPTQTCEGQSVTLDAGADYVSYFWSPGGQATRTITVSPAATTVYTVTVSNGTCPPASGTHTVTVLANPAPTISGEDVPPLPRDDFYVTNGTVSAAAASGGILYIGGDFTRVGPNTGRGIGISTATGAPDLTYPRVNGNVECAVSDGAGGWYIGGSFTNVGGAPRNRIAHILSDKSVDPAWNPNADNTVHALKVSGSTVYAGGNFTSIGGQPRNSIAALMISTGNATAWNPSATGGTPLSEVHALEVSGSVVYAGGNFTTIGGQTRNNIAALDASTGNATAWNPNATGNVYTLALSGAVYAGGSFTTIGGQARSNIAALDPSTGSAATWNPSANGAVISLVISGSTIYVGGVFTSIGGQSRNRIAAVGLITGTATAWNPNANNAVFALALSGSTVYVAGYFALVGGQPRNCIAAIDATTGNATAWNPNADNGVEALAVSGSTVFAGGAFTTIGGLTRNYIAGVDLGTGIPTVWNPSANGSVSALSVSGSTVYAGGSFTSIGGQMRNRIAALSSSTGGATSWNPNASGTVSALAMSESAVFAGGSFNTIGGQTRNGIAALSVSSGTATSWNPNANSAVSALAISGATVYAGGGFSMIGGQPRNKIAALNAATGAATGWNPNANGSVTALIVSGSTVYAGGQFTTIGGQMRNSIAALDAATGNASAWNPNANGCVNSVLPLGSTVYAGGEFTTIGGQARGRLAALDSATGEATAWNPTAVGAVNTLVASGAGVFAGGSFTTMGDLARPSVAFFDGSVVCPSGTRKLNASEASSYQWCRDGAILPGETNLTHAASQPGSYTVAVTNANGCSSTSTSYVLTAPGAPTISGTDTNSCPTTFVALTTESGKSGYQWYRDGSPIDGANWNTLSAGSTGNYTVSYASNSGCTVTSAGHAVTISPCSPPPVADGRLSGTAARFSKNVAAPSQIDVTYGVTPCATSKAVVLYGTIGNYSGYQGCAQPDAGNGGAASIAAGSLTNVWFNIVWTAGNTAGHPGYGFNGTTDVERTWNAVGQCGLTADDHSDGTCD